MCSQNITYHKLWIGLLCRWTCRLLPPFLKSSLYPSRWSFWNLVFIQKAIQLSWTNESTRSLPHKRMLLMNRFSSFWCNIFCHVQFIFLPFHFHPLISFQLSLMTNHHSLSLDLSLIHTLLQPHYDFHYFPALSAKFHVLFH